MASGPGEEATNRSGGTFVPERIKRLAHRHDQEPRSESHSIRDVSLESAPPSPHAQSGWRPHQPLAPFLGVGSQPSCRVEIDIGKRSPAVPVTPQYVRVRIRRVELRADGQRRDPERGEGSSGQCDGEGWTVCQSRPSRCEEDLHLIADEHVRHTSKRPELS